MAESKSKTQADRDAAAREQASRAEDESSQPVLDPDNEVRAQAPTHADYDYAVEMENREEAQEKLVQERAADRDVVASYPPPATSSYIYVPEELREKVKGKDPETGEEGDEVDIHKGHAVQVAQVRTFDHVPTQVTLRCDCGREWTVNWTEEYATRAYTISDKEIEELRSVPERFQEKSDERRGRTADKVT